MADLEPTTASATEAQPTTTTSATSVMATQEARAPLDTPSTGTVTATATASAAAATTTTNTGGIASIRMSGAATTSSGTQGAPQAPPSPSILPNLLREWNTPPVAPAIVVLHEEDGARDESHDAQGHASTLQETEQPRVATATYPVAALVSNFVRTSVNELRDHIESHIYASAIPEEEATSNDPISIRSAPPHVSAAAAAAAAASIRNVDLDFFETVSGGMGDSAEFVLIDGDLVAIPQHQESENASIDELSNHTYNSNQHRNCHTSRMRRGVRGIRKWIKRKKLLGRKALKQGEDHFRDQLQQGLEQAVGLRPSRSQDDPSSAAASACSSIRSFGLESTESPPRRSKQKKKKRLAWLRDSERRPSSSAESASVQDQQSLQDSAQILPPNSDQPAIACAEEAVAMPAAPAATTYASADCLLNRSASIAAEASFIGNADQLLEAGVLQASVAAEAYIEERLDDYDKYDKKDVPYLASVVPRDADYKVDKQDSPCVESMLIQAGEFSQDLEESAQDSLLSDSLGEFSTMASRVARQKSDGISVPLSDATSEDPQVHNDILKLVMMGAPNVEKSALARALRKSTKKSKKRSTLTVDVHSWTPHNNDQVKFTIWDVQGASDSTELSTPNFGAHPGTQSLFFSDRTLYLLVWDLAVNNSKTYRRGWIDEDDDSDDDDEENEYEREEANRQADRALQTDFEDRVLSWLEYVARRGAHSAILPIALVPPDMLPQEARRRCDVMQQLLMDYTQRKVSGDLVPPKVLTRADHVICVSLESGTGMDQLQETILAIATDSSHSVFDHVGTPVPSGAMHVLETVRRLKKQEHKLVLVDHLMAELRTEISVDCIRESLEFLSSIGELLYFGADDEMLSQYVILNRKWLVSALSCILRNDLKRELAETRRFMNMQCIYSDQQFPEDNVTRTFSTNTSSCPLLSSTDTQMLWQSMNFMREAADRTAQLSENSTTASSMFGFLERLLVHSGVFLPLDVGDLSTSPVYFVPSLLSQVDSRNVWTFKSSESWMATLSHSWLFRDGAPSGLMEHITVALLRDLYEFAHTVKPHNHLPRSTTYPFAQNGMENFVNSREGEAIGQIKIHQIMCWKSSLLVKIGCIFPDGNELRESFVEIFVAIADQSSPHCVAADAMQSSMQRLVVSGKGQVGHHGRKLWKGGYGIVVDSIKASVAHCTNVDRQVVCPECLAHSHPSSASTWGWDSVRAAAETGSSHIRCMKGHRVDSNLICGTLKSAFQKPEPQGSGTLPNKAVRDLLPSVVVVGLWDADARLIRNVGSGFIVDKRLGLVVTAGHVLFQMQEGPKFGTRYFGYENAKAVIGVIPADGSGDTAVFRYFAEIVADDVRSVDACVLRITTRMENDIDNDVRLGEEPESPVDLSQEQLSSLKMTRRYELEEPVRVLGFNQGGEGLLEKGKHVNRSADFAKGYICKQFKMADDHSSSSGESSSGASGFSPREEIVIMCPTISGHSGGPCVNDEGKVVGILSRADPVDRQRCYLVPSSELKPLVSKAKKSSSRVPSLKMYSNGL